MKLIKQNNLTKEEMKFLNEESLKNIFEYNFVKYPQSSETEANQELSKILVKRNNIADPNNDLVEKFEKKTGISFALKKDG